MANRCKIQSSIVAMAVKAKPSSSPLTFDLGHDLQSKLQHYEKKLGPRSTSSIIRFALENFSFERYTNEEKPHKQISVRLPLELKQRLIRFSDKKSVSVGELLRAALTALPENPPQDLTQQIHDSTMATKKTKTSTPKKSAKKAVKKTAKKPTKKTAKKAAPKKTVKKAAPKKKAVKKAAPKKKATKKAAKKSAVKKAAKKTTKAKKAPSKKAAKKAAPKKTASKKKAAPKKKAVKKAATKTAAKKKKTSKKKK